MTRFKRWSERKDGRGRERRVENKSEELMREKDLEQEREREREIVRANVIF